MQSLQASCSPERDKSPSSEVVAGSAKIEEVKYFRMFRVAPISKISNSSQLFPLNRHTV